MDEKVLREGIWTASLGRYDEVYPCTKKEERASGLGYDPADLGQEDSSRILKPFTFSVSLHQEKCPIKEDICETC